MKILYKTFSLILLLIIGCNNSDDNNVTDNNANGTIQLSGDDTSEVGTTLVVGDIAEGRVDLTGIEDSIVIVEEGTTISESGSNPFVDDDPNNGFVIVVGANSISMTIIVNGTSYLYACTGFATFIDCGSLDLNLSENRMVFNDSTAENTETGTILTLNGTVTW